MPIYASDNGNGDFKPAPAGTYQAVCVDVHDEGIHRMEFNGESREAHKISIAWQINEDREDGKPFLVTKWYTLSLHKKSALRPDLESWRGRAFTEEELKRFDVETVLGANCMLSIVHADRNGKTYANVAAVMALPKGMAKLEPRDFIRKKDRPKEEPKKQDREPGVDDGDPGPLPGGWDDDLPF